MSRVILRTVPYRKPVGDKEKDETPPPCHLTVFRNVQGMFMPAISDADEYQFWRIQKVDGGIPGEPIKGGDAVRLTWRFADQTLGFRDYKDDVFGRRCNHCPPEVSTPELYLKVPWPRFEPSTAPTALVMSTKASKDIVGEPIQTRSGLYPYLLQDLQFRIDAVENGGHGDSADYMMNGVKQATKETRISVSFGDPAPPIREPPPLGALQVGMRTFGVSNNPLLIGV